ncbi:GNAT family N-acetyltransferase [Lentzea sp. NPDC005914]|uniref:GNAT family N-acetyltransferase n=1 Tax=Lentzea sp. NPDC005914 TaxID=3154572 RepID=UPI0033FDBEB9
MGVIDIEELDFANAAEADQRELFDLQVDWWTKAMPPRRLPDFSGWVRRNQTPEGNWGRARFLVARENGHVVGYAYGYLPTTDNTHLVAGSTIVGEQWRRRGIGTALLRHALRLANRDTAGVSWIPGDSEGARWATRRGFTVVSSLTLQDLVLTDPLPEVGEVPPGHRLVQWTGRAPDDLLDAYVDALNTTGDQPMGDSPYELATFTRERVRQAEDELLAAGGEVWVVLALHGTEAAAVTVLHRRLSRPSVGHQQHTGVLRAHRGKGLGRLVKAHLLHQLTGFEIIETETNTTNEQMLRINHSLGFTDRLITVDLSARVADLML